MEPLNVWAKFAVAVLGKNIWGAWPPHHLGGNHG